jgi:hypothetical protein
MPSSQRTRASGRDREWPTSAWLLCWISTPDGKRAAIFPRADAEGDGEGIRVTVLLNFFVEARGRLP